MKKLLLPLLLVTLCSCNPTNNSSSQQPNSSSSLSTSQQVIELDEVKNNAIMTLTNAFNHYDIDDYSNANWSKLLDILTKAEYDIYNATNASDVEAILAKALSDLDNVATYAEEKQNEKTVVELNQTISIGNTFTYSLNNIANPEKIMRVKVVLDIDFKGANQNSIYWGGDIIIGATRKAVASSGYEDRVDANDDGTPESTTQTINVDVTNLTSQNNVEILLTYAGGNYDIKVSSLSFYYNNDYELKEEKVVVNKSIYNNQKVQLAYSELQNKGDVYKIELNLTITGNQTYTGGSVFVTGCSFTPSNTVNIGDIMVANQVSTGSVYIYPEEKIDLSIAEEFSFTSWWAPASEIILNYVTIYTKN